MCKWECKVVQLNQEAGWSAQLTAIGAEGWELITIVHGPDVAGFAAVFKRAVEHGEGQ